MGSPFTIILWHKDSLEAKSLIDKCISITDSLVQVFSDYDAQAETYRFNTAEAGKWIACSPAMMQLVSASVSAANLFHGRFDFTMGTLAVHWRKWRRNNIFPDSDSVALLKAISGLQLLRIDSLQGRMMKKHSHLALDFGAIAKGYIAGQVKLYCAEQNTPMVLVDAGGDIVCGNAPPGKNGWSIGVNMPQSEDIYPQTILLANKAVATSGDMYQGMMHKGKWYSHIIDPRTGYGTTHRRNVTVIARDGATADWLATALSILPLKKIKPLARKMEAEWMIAMQKRGDIIIRRSRNFPEWQNR